MKPATIEADVVYISPTGRRCKLVPPDNPHRVRTAYAFFVYLNADSALSDGFTLTPRNFGLLRREGKHATAR